MGKIYSLVIAIVLCSYTESYAQISSPKINGQPVQVGIKFLVNEILEISTVEESFDIDGYLTLIWNDPKIAELFPESQDKTMIIYMPNMVDSIFEHHLWHPNVEIMNSIGARNISQKRIELRGTQIVYVERFQTKVQTEMNFARFPFDEQTCSLVLESFGFNKNDFEFVNLPVDQLVVDDIENDAWEFSTIATEVYPFEYKNSISKKDNESIQFSRFKFSIHAARKSGYFIWQFFLPLFILLVATWFIPALWKTGSSHELIFTMLLASVMFGFYTSPFLPQLSYNTFLEATVIVTNGVVFSTLLLVLTRKNDASKVRFYCRIWFIPVMSIAAFVITSIYFFLV
ncbi:hypothetical protein [Fluviicola taffensis]|uniref:hypothetical protein n=1 Tax=Fluviicola taffensis TaxID=191579 RepID=UPI00313789BC